MIASILKLVISGVLVAVIYIFLHETGHLIVLLSEGAVIDEFSILEAHVSAHGGRFDLLSGMLLHANGALLPLLISYIYLLFYRSNSENEFYILFSWVTAIVPAASMLAWVVIPFLYMAGIAPEVDDVTHFLEIFPKEYPPYLVSLIALIFIGISALIVVEKHIMRDFIRCLARN